MVNESEPTVKVQFFGICTHMEPQHHALEPAHWGHRVVLVNAGDPHQSPIAAIKDLNAHVARLQLKAADIVGAPPATPWFPIVFNDGETIEWSLRGVVIRIGEEKPLEGSRTGDCIPHLRHCCEHLPPAGPATYVEDRAKTSCFFDFGRAVFAGKLHGNGASMGVLTVGTTPTPTIRVKDFGPEGAEIAFAIRAGAEVSVSNIPLDPKADKEQDFLLHFLTAKEYPVGTIVPPRGFTCSEPLETYNLPRHLGDITGPGCSNSSYP